MPRNINHCVLEGRLGADPEERVFASGSKIVNARIAVSDDYKDKQGQWQSKTYWISIQAMGWAADQLLKGRKGQVVIAIGSWTIDEAEKNGQKNLYHKLKASEIRLLAPKEKASSDHQSAQRAPASHAPSSTPDDDDLPF